METTKSDGGHSSAGSHLNDCRLSVAIVVDDNDKEAKAISTNMSQCIYEHCSIEPVVLNERAMDPSGNCTTFEDVFQSFKMHTMILIITHNMLNTSLYTKIKSAMSVMSAPYLIPVLHKVGRCEVLQELRQLCSGARMNHDHELQLNEDNLLHYSDDNLHQKICAIINGSYVLLFDPDV